jgi:hypothetical protein
MIIRNFDVWVFSFSRHDVNVLVLFAELCAADGDDYMASYWHKTRHFKLASISRKSYEMIPKH